MGKSIIELFKKPGIIGIIGDVNEAKSNLLYHIIETLRKERKFNLYTYKLKNIKSNKIHSVDEMEQIKDSIIVLDEIMSLWDLENRMEKRKIEATLRLINHRNNVLIICAVPENIKKFIASKFNYVLFKKITISDLINGSRVKNIIKNYRGNEKGSNLLNLEKNEALLFDGLNYEKIDVPYYRKYDVKKDNVSILVKKNIKKKV